MRRAFTLVELIVVVIIIGILLSVGIPQYRKALERSRGAEGYAGLAHIQQGEKVYFASYEHYLTTGNDPATQPGGIVDSSNQTALDITLPQIGWYFNVTSGNAAKNFQSTAFRISGPCSGHLLFINENGTPQDDAADPSWKFCVDNDI